MAGQNGPETNPLTERLAQDARRYDFFVLARFLEAAQPEKPPIGTAQKPPEDVARFGQKPDLAFAPSTVESVDLSQSPPKVFVRFMGLLGPNGPLPLHITEYARDRVVNRRDGTLASFLDIFNHRMIALFYRAWAVNQQSVALDRHEGRFTAYVASLMGMGMESLRHRNAVPDGAKLHYAGRLAFPTSNAEGLQAILAEFFGVPVEIEEFVGQWADLAREYRCELGRSRETGLLGGTAILGERVWDCQQRFRVKMGPMGLEDYERLLPGGDSFRRLEAWVHDYAGTGLAWDVRLVLRAEDVAPAQLGRRGRLGWTTWLLSGRMERDADQLVVAPFSSRRQAERRRCGNG